MNELEEIVLPAKRQRRATLDMRTPADIVPPEYRTKVAASYWLTRLASPKKYRHKGGSTMLITVALMLRPDHTTLLWQAELFKRLYPRASVLYTSYRMCMPTPQEVAACCWSVKTYATYRSSFFSHLNSAAHLAQHFGVNARDIIHEARQWQIAVALSEGSKGEE